MPREMMTRRQFGARSAAALGSFALAGCVPRSAVRPDRRYGVRTEYEPLQRVLVHAPSPAVGDLPTPADLERFHFDAELDHARAVREHTDFTRLLRAHGAEVIEIRDVLSNDSDALAVIDSDPNFMFTRDIMTMTPNGALLMRMGLAARRPEVAIVARAMKRLGIPIVGAMREPATLEGGSVMWLDPETLIVGKCERTNDAAINQMRTLMRTIGARTLIVAHIPQRIHIDGLIAVPGPGTVFIRSDEIREHDADVITRGGPARRARFADVLEEAGNELVAVERICNEIYTAPFVGIAVSAWSRDDAKRALDSRGGRLVTFRGDELIKGFGGAHCMTCPLWRVS